MLGLALLALLPAALAAGAEPTNEQINSVDYWTEQAHHQGRHLCFVTPDKDGGDDAPAIQKALNHDCRSKSLVIFPGPTYNIQTPMITDDLDDVVIEHFGTLLWSQDVDYWLTVTMPMGFQNQSTVWFFGGNNILWDGHNVGTFDGNGQVWYDWAKSQGNLAHRPMNINYRGFNNSKVERMRYVQSQMWTMTVSYSHNVELEDIYVNSTSTSNYSTLNTDGCDTWRADNVRFKNWSVTNGDDCIALKGNSSNIYIDNLECWDGTGIAIGSLAQYNGQYEHVENFYVNNVTVHNTVHAIYYKTWAGNQNGYPPNGGGGGLGYAKNLVAQDITLDLVRDRPFFLWQCENYSGDSGEDCDSSKFHFSDISWKNVQGTTIAGVVHGGWLECSLGAGGCDNITLENYSVRADGSTDILDDWYCDNVHNNTGFVCSST